MIGATEELDFAAHVHGDGVVVDPGGLAGKGTDGVSRLRLVIRGLLRLEHPHRVIMHGQQVAHGNTLQHYVPSSRFTFAPAINKRLVCFVPDGGSAKDRSHFFLLAWFSQGCQHLQRDPPADAFLQQFLNRSRQRPAHPLRRGEFQGLLRVFADQFPQRIPPLRGQFEACALQRRPVGRIGSRAVLVEPIGKRGECRLAVRGGPSTSGGFDGCRRWS